MNKQPCVCNLTDRLETGQSRRSFHLKRLKDAGLITDRREGRWGYYALNPEVVADMARFLEALSSQSRQSRDARRCCD